MVKNLSANVGDTGSIPGSGRSPGEENIDSLQYSCLGNPMDRKPGRLLQSMGSETVGRDLVTKWASLIAHWLKKKKDLPAMWETPVQFLGQEDPLEKGKAIHFSILTWRIPWTL